MNCRSRKAGSTPWVRLFTTFLACKSKPRDSAHATLRLTCARAWGKLVVLFLFCAIHSYGQTEADSIVTTDSKWNSPSYSQEDKIFNRSVWTFIDNPALVGFDRKLAIAYRFRIKNLAMGVPNEDGNLVLALMQHEAFLDLSLGGPKQNWGTVIYYSNEKEFQHSIQRIVSASSFQVNIKEHHLIFGIKATFQLSKLNDWDRLSFGDMIDPRSGFVYQTNEVKPNNRYNFRGLLKINSLFIS